MSSDFILKAVSVPPTLDAIEPAETAALLALLGEVADEYHERDLDQPPIDPPEVWAPRLRHYLERVLAHGQQHTATRAHLLRLAARAIAAARDLDRE